MSGVIHLPLCVPRWATQPDRNRELLGWQAVRIAKLLGRELIPWQADLFEVALEVDADRHLVYRDVAFGTPRQSGKSYAVLVAMVRQALYKRDARVTYSAQNGLAARTRLLDEWAPQIRSSPLAETIQKVRSQSGSEAILFRNGSQIAVMASGESAGHGPSIDLGVIDEAWADTDSRREQSLKPSMAARRDAQLWACSTAGTEASVYWRRRVDAGRAIVTDRINDARTCYIEYSADPGADPGNPATWRSCQPALGYLIDEANVRHEQATMEPEEFARGFLNMFTTGERSVIPMELWRAVSADVKPSGGLVFGIDATPDRSAGAIVAVDTSRRAEVVEHREGVTWMVERVVELAKRWSGRIAVDVRGPAAPLIPEIKDQGGRVVEYGSQEMAGATARLYDAIADQEIKVRPHPALETAVEGATKRVAGDLWFWGRSASHVDISPLVALSLAYDQAVVVSRKVEPGAFWAP